MKTRPLTAIQQECLMTAEDTLYGDTKLIPGYGRSMPGLRMRGYVEGEGEHVYLTEAGKEELARLAHR